MIDRRIVAFVGAAVVGACSAVAVAIPGSAGPLDETVLVDSGKATGASTAFPLIADNAYTFRVSRTYAYAPDGWRADGECSALSDDSDWKRNRFGDDPLDVYVQGKPLNWKAEVADEWGCSRNHAYTVEYVARATGHVTFAVSDVNHNDNSGILTVQVSENPDPTPEPTPKPDPTPAPEPEPDPDPEPTPDPTIKSRPDVPKDKDPEPAPGADQPGEKGDKGSEESQPPTPSKTGPSSTGKSSESSQTSEADSGSETSDHGAYDLPDLVDILDDDVSQPLTDGEVALGAPVPAGGTDQDSARARLVVGGLLALSLGLGGVAAGRQPLLAFVSTSLGSMRRARPLAPRPRSPRGRHAESEQADDLGAFWKTFESGDR